MKTFITLLVSTSVMLFSCENTKSDENTRPDISTVSEVLSASNTGYELLKSTCYACHNPATKSHDEILAPPLAGIKMRYLRQFNTKKDFVKGMSSFISNPSEDKALMRGPVRRFGLMPNPNLDEADVKLIVEFIYENKLEEPAWFAKHHEEMHGND